MTAQRGALRYAGRALAALVAAGFVGLLVYGLLTKSPSSTIDDSLKQSRSVAAPGFELPVLLRPAPGSEAAHRAAPALADGRVSLRELRGAPVVLNIWASWCIPCRDETPELQRGWERDRDRGVIYVGLDMQDITDDALAFSRQFGVDYLNVRDGTNKVARSFGATGVPETYFISAAGRVVGHVVGVVAPPQLRDGVAAAIAGRPLGVEQGGARRKAP